MKQPTLNGLISTDFCNLIGEPFLVVDSGGKVIASNSSLETLIPGHEKVLGKYIRDVPGLSSLWNSILSSMENKEYIKDRVRIRDSEYEAAIRPVQTANGPVVAGVLLYEITQYLTIEKELLRRNRELMIINTLSGTFISTYEIEKIFTELLEKVVMITDFSVGWISLIEDGKFILKSHTGISLDLLKKLNEGCFDEIIKPLLESEEPLYIFEKDEIHKVIPLRQERLAFLGIIPLYISNKLSGVIFLGSRSERAFDFDLASMMSLVGNQVSLIIEKVQLFEETKRLSITDPLTGLYNVRFFYLSLTNELERARRYRDTFSLIIFDIDDFKTVNDTYGHQVGDEILRDIAEILLQSSRKTDIVARYGGEEFVIILPKTGMDAAFLLADRIREHINEHMFVVGDIKLRITVSGGISTYPKDGITAKELLYASDMALYKAKAEGKKKVVCYNAEKTLNTKI